MSQSVDSELTTLDPRAYFACNFSAPVSDGPLGALRPVAPLVRLSAWNVGLLGCQLGRLARGEAVCLVVRLVMGLLSCRLACGRGASFWLVVRLSACLDG